MGFKGIHKYAVVMLAECLGTGLLLFFGCMGAYVSPRKLYWDPNCNGFDCPAIDNPTVQFVFGAAVLCVIQIFGHVSGAHVNPAVSIAALLMGKMSLIEFPLYIVAQLLGGFLGFGLLTLLISDNMYNTDIPGVFSKEGFCMTQLNENHNTLEGTCYEMIFTSIVVLLCCAFWDKRNEKNTDAMALKFGAILIGVMLAGHNVTGTSMNSVRSLWPAVFSDKFDNQWIFWVGPNCGAVVGVIIYKLFFSLPRVDNCK